MNQLIVRLGMCGLLILCHAPLTVAANKPKSNMAQDDNVQALLETEAQATNASVDRRESLKPMTRPQSDPGPVWWQAGYVQSEKQWRSFEDNAASGEYATLLDEYRSERIQFAGKPRGRWQLANWCRKNGLPDQERVHLLQVLADRDPQVRADAAYERLGYQEVGNAWVSPEERRVRLDLAAEIDRSHKQWGSRLRSIRQRLQGSPRQRALGEKQLAEIRETSAIPAIVELLCLNDQSSAEVGVRTLGQITEYQSSRALAGQAVTSPWKSVRTQAMELLKHRKLEEFVPDLLLLLSFPIRPSQDQAALKSVLSNNKPVPIPGLKTTWDSVWIEETHDSIRIEIQRLIPVSVATLTEQSRQRRTFSDADLAVAMAVCELSLQADLTRYAADKINDSRADMNERVCGVLSSSSGRPMSVDSHEWIRWWADFASNSTVSEKPVVIVDERRPVLVDDRVPPARLHSCLVAGTPVWTERGFVSIEQIRPGDRVLSKQIASGELTYKPVLVSTVRDSTPVQQFTIADDTIVASHGHHFWASGDGWTKMRELIPQLPLHTATGMQRITRVEDEGRSEKVYNLVVADFHTYFVGKTMVLSHDVTTPALTNVKVPGLTPQ